MAISPADPACSVGSATIAELAERIAMMQGGRRSRIQELPVHPLLAPVLSLRPGGVYTADSASLVAALVAGPSVRGDWCAVVGAPDLGLESAVALGVELTRTVLVPDPGIDWIEIVAAVAEVVTLVAVRPPSDIRVTDREASRLAARLRKCGTALVVWGSWPRCDLSLFLSQEHWQGIGRGYGRLLTRRATVLAQRPGAPARRHEVSWPSDPFTQSTSGQSTSGQSFSSRLKDVS